MKPATYSSPYEQHRDYVLSVLARRCGWLNVDDREAVFHDAYAVMLEKQQAGALDVEEMHERQLRAYLTQTAINKALDEGKRAERNRTESLGDSAFAAPDDARTPEDLAGAKIDGARMAEIVAELPQRRQAIVKLRFYFDRTPEEIQGYLDISERAYRRELERALRYIAERYELVREGRFCDSRRSLILAYVCGIAGPNRAREAATHLATCRGCAHWAAGLREAARRGAAFLPLPSAALDTHRLQRIGEIGDAVRDSLGQIAVAAKQHATTLATRVDTTAAGYAGAARPGTVAAAVAGCIAIGGGATYCAVDGLPAPIRPLVHHAAAKKEPRSATKPRTTPTPAAVSSTPSQTAPAPAPHPAQTAPTQEAPPPSTAAQSPPPAPPPAEQEFGLETPAPEPAARAPANPPSGAQKPPATPGEFDP
jgi:RNA polymerase sigma factor (sigma-70 family)